MKVVAVEGTVTAVSPIFHGGDEKTGSTPVLRAVTCYVEGRGLMPIPYVSGNSVRGRLRRLAVRDMLDAVGYEPNSAGLHHMLYSGGMLESTKGQEGVIDLEFRRRVRDALPVVALFGCSVGNQMIPSCLTVEHLWPICEETAPQVPARFRADARASMPVRAFTDQAFKTRRDELRATRREDEHAVQMKVNYECFIPGTLFYHRFVLTQPNALELAALGHIIELWAESPTIGGHSASGDGRLKLEYESVPDASLYKAYLRASAAEVRAVLADLEARL